MRPRFRAVVLLLISAQTCNAVAALTETEEQAVAQAGTVRTGEGKTAWKRITFPGPRHKEDPAFPTRQGSDRSEYMWFFRVSNVDPSFMLLSHNMGAASIARDGRCFEPLDMPLHRYAVGATFCPHDGNVAYLIQGHKGHASSAASYSGIWRTRDMGRTWTQIYRMPEETRDCMGPWGKQLLAVDPHPDRAGHIYFATIDNGLIRSVDDGVTWQSVAFPGLPVKTIATASGPKERTVLYVIVGVKGRYGRRDNVLGGTLWRVEVEPVSPFKLTTIQLSEDDDFWDLAVSPVDWSRGMIIREYHERGTAGGKKLVPFEGGGTKLGKTRSAGQAGVSHFCDVHINPQNGSHVVVRSQGDLSKALQYSLDGAATWNAPYKVVDGHLPDLVSFNPAHHDAPNGAMREAAQQGQGTAVGFDARDPRVVYWWTQNFDKTPLRSEDWGATWRPFAYGGPFKGVSQISLASDGSHLGTARHEYGFVTSRDGGLSWTGSTPETDAVLASEVSAAEAKGEGDGPDKKYGWGLACKPGEPRVMVGVFGAFWSILTSRDGGIKWEDTGVDAGGPGCVYWHHQEPSVVYAADRRSVDGGKTWTRMDRFALNVSASNGDVLLGNKKAGSLALSLSMDRGATWTDLPPVPQEDGRAATAFLLATRIPIAHGVAIDPDPARDPVKGTQGIRVLLAARSGVYEFSGRTGTAAAQGKWDVIHRGFERSIHFPNAYWLGHVVFDPRPGMHHVVYACKSEDPVLTGAWRGNASTRHSQPERPLYRSLDGGRTWGHLHGPQHLGIPDHLDVLAVAVSPKDGSLHVDGFCGMYVLPGVPAHHDRPGVKY